MFEIQLMRSWLREFTHKLDSQSIVFNELEIWFLIAIMFLFAIIYTDNFVIKIFNFLLILIYIYLNIMNENSEH